MNIKKQIQTIKLFSAYYNSHLKLSGLIQDKNILYSSKWKTIDITEQKLHMPGIKNFEITETILCPIVGWE